MITGDTKHLAEYQVQLPEKIYECLEKIRAFDFAAVPDGRYEVEGCGMMSVESPETEPAVMRRMEGHRKYIDVVYLVEGEEWIGCIPRHDTGAPKESYPEKDLYFFEGTEDETRVHMLPGRFLVCWPEDLHRPLCAGASGVAKIRKAVLKVPV